MVLGRSGVTQNKRDIVAALSQLVLSSLSATHTYLFCTQAQWPTAYTWFTYYLLLEVIVWAYPRKITFVFPLSHPCLSPRPLRTLFWVRMRHGTGFFGSHTPLVQALLRFIRLGIESRGRRELVFFFVIYSHFAWMSQGFARTMGGVRAVSRELGTSWGRICKAGSFFGTSEWDMTCLWAFFAHGYAVHDVVDGGL